MSRPALVRRLPGSLGGWSVVCGFLAERCLISSTPLQSAGVCRTVRNASLVSSDVVSASSQEAGNGPARACAFEHGLPSRGFAASAALADAHVKADDDDFDEKAAYPPEIYGTVFDIIGKVESPLEIKPVKVFAVVQIGSQQFKVSPDDVLYVEKLHADINDKEKDKKVIIFKKKRRKNYRRTNGHRQSLTSLRILEINGIEEAPQ
eukprot:jgi/Mesvir1/19107/Mv12852-RA.2